MDGLALIAKERERQKNIEGWTEDHDDQHDQGELALAAASYALPQAFRQGLEPPVWWPWDRSWWKPTLDPIRALEKAGALIAAEIDRLKRSQR